MTLETCENSYTVVGAIYDGEETESISNNVFTDREPFECELASATQSVVLSLNSSATDPVTSCTYNVVRKHKATGLTLGATETLECGHLHLPAYMLIGWSSSPIDDFSRAREWPDRRSGPQTS